MSPSPPSALDEVVQHVSGLLQARLQHLVAVYVFGSRASGEHTGASDWDFALWVDGKLEPLVV